MAKVIESVVKIDIALGDTTKGDDLVDLIQDHDLEYHVVTVDEDDSDVLVFTKYADD